MRTLTLVIVLTLFGWFAHTACGDLILEFSGTSGNSNVGWNASGSVTLPNAVNNKGSSVMNLPIGGQWNSAFDNNLGDLIQNGQSNLFNLSTSGFAFSINGTLEFFIPNIDITADDDPGEDDIELDVPGTTNFPVLDAGDVLSWSGSGQFSLGSVTYDEYFVGGTSSTVPIDGGNFILNIGPTTGVPEPSSFVMFASGIWGMLAMKRRRPFLHFASSRS